VVPAAGAALTVAAHEWRGRLSIGAVLDPGAAGAGDRFVRQLRVALGELGLGRA
jgi:hypothetical protein